jgi:hypothetical protein
VFSLLDENACTDDDFLSLALRQLKGTYLGQEQRLRAYLAWVQKRGLVERRSGVLRLTEAGSQRLTAQDVPLFGGSSDMRKEAAILSEAGAIQ